MPLRLVRSGVIDHVLWLISIQLVDSARRMGEPRTPLAVNDHCRSGGWAPPLPATFPRLPAASHDYLLPPTTPAGPTTTCHFPRLPATSHDACSPTTPAAHQEMVVQ